MKISAIIPAYNAEQTIARAIKSVLAQTRPADEIIVIDDGSSDGTAEAVRAFGDKVILIQQENSGVSVARNTGIRAATGDWIAFLDADDEWLPDKLKLQGFLLERHPDISWVSGNYYRCDCSNGHRKVLQVLPEEVSNIRQRMANFDVFEDYFTAFISYAAGHTDAMMVKKCKIIEAGFFCEKQTILEDDDLWLRLAYLGLRYGFVFDPVCTYHLHVSQSLTKLHIDSMEIDSYMGRHLQLSSQSGKLTEFLKCASGMLSHRLRLLLACRKGREVRVLLSKYGDTLAPGYRRSCYVGSFCPILWTVKEIVKRKIRKGLGLRSPKKG